MTGLRFWGILISVVVPALVVAAGLLPPHVVPALEGPMALAALMIVVALAGSGRLRSPGPGVALALAASGFLAVLSSCLAMQPWISARTLIAWFAAGIVFTASRAVPGEAEAGRLASSVAVLALILGTLGLYQSLVAFPEAARVEVRAGGEGASAGTTPRWERRLEVEEARLRSGRAVGTLGFPAALASLLILGLPLTAARAIGSSGAARASWAAATVLLAAALVATRSIGAAGALGGALILSLPFWRGIDRRYRIALAASVLAVGAIVVAPRLAATGEGSGLLSLSLRAANWKAGLSMLVSHPFLGVGPGNYGVAFPLHRTWASNETQHAHNAYLEIASDLGVMAIPFLVLGAFALIGWIRIPEAAGERGGRLLVHRALALSSLAWAAQNLFDFTAYLSATAIPFAAVLGLLARSAAAYRERGPGGEAPPAALQPRPAGMATRSILLAAAVLAALMAVGDSLSRIHLDRAVDAAAARDFETGAIEARRASVLNPWDPEARVVLSQSLIDAALHRPDSDPGRPSLLEDALVEAEEGVRLDPFTANRRAALAMARAAVGDAAGAYAALAAASRLNPFKASYGIERDQMLGILEGESPGEASTGQGPP